MVKVIASVEPADTYMYYSFWCFHLLGFIICLTASHLYDVISCLHAAIMIVYEYCDITRISCVNLNESSAFHQYVVNK